jgi:hypothetical protein
MFGLLEAAGFARVKSAVVSTQNAAESYGVKAVMMTAEKPAR